MTREARLRVSKIWRYLFRNAQARKWNGGKAELSITALTTSQIFTFFMVGSMAKSSLGKGSHFTYAMTVSKRKPSGSLKTKYTLNVPTEKLRLISTSQESSVWKLSLSKLTSMTTLVIIFTLTIQKNI